MAVVEGTSTVRMCSMSRGGRPVARDEAETLIQTVKEKRPGT